MIPGIRVLDDINNDELRTVEMPAVNGIGTAASIAKAYGCAATGGTEIGLTGHSRELTMPAAPPPVVRETRFSVSRQRSLWALSNRIR